MALLCVMFPRVFVTFRYGVSDQVWYLIVSISDLYFLLYFLLALSTSRESFYLFHHNMLDLFSENAFYKLGSFDFCVRTTA